MDAPLSGREDLVVHERLETSRTADEPHSGSNPGAAFASVESSGRPEPEWCPVLTRTALAGVDQDQDRTRRPDGGTTRRPDGGG